MKKIFMLLTLICLYNLAAKAQSFVSENKLWSIISKDASSGEELWKRTSYYKFSGDTVFKQTAYKKLYETEDEQKENWELNSLWYERNDSVFKYSASEEENVLIYDFNLQENDSFYVAPDIGYIYVDSVRIKQWGGKEREHIYFSTPDQAGLLTIWRQGVGQDGLITCSSEIYITGTFVKILCFSENGEQVYQNPDYDCCYIRTSVDQQRQNEQLIKCWSVGGQQVNIKLTDQNSGLFTLYLYDGKPVNETCITNGETVVCTPGSGIYIFRFENSRGQVQTGKIIVE